MNSQRNIAGGEHRTGDAFYGVTRQHLRQENEEGFGLRAGQKRRTVRVVFNRSIEVGESVSWFGEQLAGIISLHLFS